MEAQTRVLALPPWGAEQGGRRWQPPGPRGARGRPRPAPPPIRQTRCPALGSCHLEPAASILSRLLASARVLCTSASGTPRCFHLWWLRSAAAAQRRPFAWPRRPGAVRPCRQAPQVEPSHLLCEVCARQRWCGGRVHVGARVREFTFHKCRLSPCRARPRSQRLGPRGLQTSFACFPLCQRIP